VTCNYVDMHRENCLDTGMNSAMWNLQSANDRGMLEQEDKVLRLQQQLLENKEKLAQLRTKQMESAELEIAHLENRLLKSLREGPKVKAPSCAELQKQGAACGWGARQSTEGFGLLISRLAQTFFPAWLLGKQH